MSQDQEKLLNDSILKKYEWWLYKKMKPDNFVIPVKYSDIKDNLEKLDYCSACLFYEIEIDENSNLTVYGYKVEEVLTIITTRILELKEESRKGFISKIIEKLKK